MTACLLIGLWAVDNWSTQLLCQKIIIAQKINCNVILIGILYMYVAIPPTQLFQRLRLWDSHQMCWNGLLEQSFWRFLRGSNADFEKKVIFKEHREWMSLRTTSAGPKGYGLGPVTGGDLFPLRTRFDIIHRHNKDPVSLLFFSLRLYLVWFVAHPVLLLLQPLGNHFLFLWP